MNTRETLFRVQALATQILLRKRDSLQLYVTKAGMGLQYLLIEAPQQKL